MSLKEKRYVIFLIKLHTFLLYLYRIKMVYSNGASNPWSGLTFPGGHVEPGETVVASVIREVQEETGLTVSNLQNCGYIQWYNPIKQSQYFVLLFKTSTFSGKLTGSVEGSVKWMTLKEMLSGKLAPNMTKYLAVFQNENIPQAYGISGQGLNLIDNNGFLQ